MWMRRMPKTGANESVGENIQNVEWCVGHKSASQISGDSIERIETHRTFRTLFNLNRSRFKCGSEGARGYETIWSVYGWIGTYTVGGANACTIQPSIRLRFTNDCVQLGIPIKYNRTHFATVQTLDFSLSLSLYSVPHIRHFHPCILIVL